MSALVQWTLQQQPRTALGCGLLAGIGASALTNPFDVVKTRIQVGNAGLGAMRAASEATVGDGALSIMRSIAAKEGAAGFTRGLLPRVMLLAPLSSLTISFYSAVHRLAESVITRGKGSVEAAEEEKHRHTSGD